MKMKDTMEMKMKMKENKGYNTTKVFIAACLGLAFFGIVMLSLGVLLPPLNSVYPNANILAPVMSAGIIVGTLVFGPVMDKFGYKWLLVGGATVLLLGIMGLAYVREFHMLVFSIFLVGIGGGILNGETNALVSDIYDSDKRGSRISLLGACYCIGALLWTLGCTFIDYRYALVAVAVVMAISIIYFISIDFPKAKSDENATGSAQADSSAQAEGKSVGNNSSFWRKLTYLLSFPAFIGLALVLFMQSGFEGISGSFTTQFFENAGMSGKAATFSLTVFTIGMLCGRFILSYLMSVMKDVFVFIIYISVSLFGVLLILFMPSDVVCCYLGMALLGFGIGSTYPVVFNVIGEKFRHISGSAFSIIMFMALWGQFVYNAIIGTFFNEGNYSSFPIAMILNLVVMLLVAPVAIISLRKNHNLGR